MNMRVLYLFDKETKELGVMEAVDIWHAYYIWEIKEDHFHHEKQTTCVEEGLFLTSTSGDRFSISGVTLKKSNEICRTAAMTGYCDLSGYGPLIPD